MYNRLRQVSLSSVACLMPITVVLSLTAVGVLGDLQLCFYRSITGRPCLFCGTSRACLLAAHGQWDAAFHAHPLWWLVLAVTIFATLHYIMPAGILRRTRLRIRTAIAPYGWHIVIAVGLGSILRSLYSIS
jgi:hypothetical protein